jgi:predicted DNA-binding protein YlxM (UPF0122 family)
MYQKKGYRNRERDKIIIEKYQSGFSMPEIGTIYNISKQRIQKILIRNGIKPRGQTYPYHLTILKIIPKETLEKLYLGEKQSLQQIAVQFSISPPYVKLQLTSHGIAIRSQSEQCNISTFYKYPKLKEVTKEELYEIYVKKNNSRKYLAQLYECSIRSIDATLRKLKIKKY